MLKVIQNISFLKNPYKVCKQDLYLETLQIMPFVSLIKSKSFDEAKHDYGNARGTKSI